MTARVRGAAFLAALAGLAVLAVGTSALGAPPETGAAVVEKEFAAAIRRVTPATVVCVAKGAAKGQPGSSGVIVTKDGYVLSDGDADLVLSGNGPNTTKRHVDEVDVRVPELAAAGKPASSHVYAARVVHRPDQALGLDTSLLKITAPPSSGFSFVPVSTSDDLHVGAFTFAVGNSFGASEEGTPTLTAGIVAALVRGKAPDADKVTEIYTSAAVNPGVNGGPLVDAEGLLVGIVSTWVNPTADNPFQFLGKVVPIDRLRSAYKDIPQASVVFPDPKTLPPKSKQSEMLERAYEAAAHRAYPSVVSLEVTRQTRLRVPVSRPPGAPPSELPRYQGPTSGVAVSPDGYVVTALYNLANTLALVERRAKADIEHDLKEITGIKAHFSDGRTAVATLVARDERIGIALLKADLQGYAAKVPEAAPPESFDVGRTVLCVANPFGEARNPDPLLTVGIVSRTHPADEADSWRGDLQTDAGVTDGNAGGALVDLRGRVLGLATTWYPVQHGRNSGIGFGIPWDAIQKALPALLTGTSFRYGNGALGVSWVPDPAGGVRIVSVLPGSAAEKAGVLKDDRVVAVDGKPVKTALDAQDGVRAHSAGDKMKMTVERAGKSVEIEATLDAIGGT